MATPTDAQLNAIADQLESLAKQIRPVISPTPVPVTPTASFQGRTVLDPRLWKTVFEDDFAKLAREGDFLKIYVDWGAYPRNYDVTDKIGRYEPNNISVQDVDGLRVMNCSLMPAWTNSEGRPLGCAPYPRFPGQPDSSSKTGMRVEMRVRVTKAVKGWHAANLLWPDSEQWPRDGEIDFLEFDFAGTLGAFMHRQNGTSGGDQDAFGSSLKPTDWHIVAFEWVAGKSFKLFFDGHQVGRTIVSRVPATPMHLVLQNESYGRPTETSAIQYDWITCAVPA